MPVPKAQKEARSQPELALKAKCRKDLRESSRSCDNEHREAAASFAGSMCRAAWQKCGCTQLGKSTRSVAVGERSKNQSKSLEVSARKSGPFPARERPANARRETGANFVSRCSSTTQAW